jgi:hypothetical protein
MWIRRTRGAIVAVVVATGMATLLGVAAAGSDARSPSTARAAPPIAECAFGTDVPGLTNFLSEAVTRDADSYADGLTGASASKRSLARRTFAAAAAAYVYGLAQVSVRATIEHYPRNKIVSIAALANPQVKSVVSPNDDTAYTVAWIDLTSGPMVINVPDTGGHFYTMQLLDAFTNAFSYIGSGSTGTRAGTFALVPPGYSGTLPAGVTKIEAPSNTIWLSARTLVTDADDLPAVRTIQERYQLTPLAAWEAGTRDPPIVLDQFPPTYVKVVPTGAEFIATLDNEMNIDPPPATNDCALRAMAPAGVDVPHPTAAQTLLADQSDEPPPLPSVARDPVANAAISAGTDMAVETIAKGERVLEASSRARDNGWEILGNWVGAFGTRYLARAIVATDLLGANTPRQAMYPYADRDLAGRPLGGAHRYTIRFAKGGLPPARAFWSLTMYNAAHYLYANQIDRYEVGDRTTGLRLARNGSLTIYIQHAEPRTAAERANWLPAPAGQFHLVLRLYQPKPAALSGAWRPPPVLRAGEKPPEPS